VHLQGSCKVYIYKSVHTLVVGSSDPIEKEVDCHSLGTTGGGGGPPDVGERERGSQTCSSLMQKLLLLLLLLLPNPKMNNMLCRKGRMSWRVLLVCTVTVIGVQAHRPDGTGCDLTAYCQSRSYELCLDAPSVCRQSQGDGTCVPDTIYTETSQPQSPTRAPSTPRTVSPVPTPTTVSTETARFNATSTGSVERPMVAKPTRDSSVVTYLLAGVLASLCGGTLCCYLYKRVRKRDSYGAISPTY
jgi:hypothetical protein